MGDLRRPGRNRSVAKEEVERIPQLTGCMVVSLLAGKCLLARVDAPGGDITANEDAFNYSAAWPTVSAIVAPRAPSGFGDPTVVSRAVWCSISALSSAPNSTAIAESHSHIISP